MNFSTMEKPLPSGRGFVAFVGTSLPGDTQRPIRNHQCRMRIGRGTAPLGDQPLVLFNAVQRNKGNQNGYGLDVLLVFGIIAVVLVLADLQTAGA